MSKNELTQKQKDDILWVQYLNSCGYEDEDWADKREFDQKGHPDYENSVYETMGSGTAS